MMDRRQHIIRLIGLGVSVLVIIGSIALFASFGFLDQPYLKAVEFTTLEMTTGESMLDSMEVRQPFEKLYPGDVENLMIDSVSLQAIEAEYDANPFVRECRTFIDKHHILQVELVERIPLLRIRSQNGGDYYIDRLGTGMPVSDHYTPRIMLATGHIPILPLNESVDSSRMHSELFTVAQAINQDEFMSGLVSEIQVDESGQILLHPLVGDFTIRLNNSRDIESKFENLKIFMRDGLSRLGWDKYSELVIGYENQIIGKKIVNP